MAKKYRLIPADPNEETQEVEIEHWELAKDKNHILVFNIDVGSVLPEDVMPYIDQVKRNLEPYPEGCICYFIPHRGEIKTKIYKIDLEKQ